MGFLGVVSEILVARPVYIRWLSYLKSGLLSASNRSGIMVCIGSGSVDRMRLAKDNLISLSRVARMNAFLGCRFDNSRSSSLWSG
jgi:hypothetical protein